MKFGTNDPGQKINMEKLAAYFPQDAWGSLMQEIAGEFNQDFADTGVTFEDDLLPAIGDHPQALIGFFGQISEEKEPDILVVLSVAQPDTFVNWMERAIAEGQGQKQDYKSFAIYSGPEKESYIVPYKDVLVVASTVQIVKEALDRAEAGGPSLLSSDSYQKGLAKMPESLGFFFIDPRFSAKVLESDPEVMEELGDTEYLKSLLDAIEGEFFAFSAEPEGIRIAGAVYGDPAKWENLKDMANFDIEPAYLYKTLPGQGVLLYAESSNLKKSMEVMMQMYQHMEGFEEGMDSMKSMLKAQGIDFEKDVLAIMDKGYAFGLYDLGTIVPSFGLFVDASSNRSGAENIMSQLYAGIDGQLQGVPADLASLLSHEESATKGGEHYNLRMDLTKLPEEELQDVPAELRTVPLELNYGVNADNLAYMAFYPGFDQANFSPLESNDRFRAAMVKIPGFDRGVTYLDFESLMTYVDRVVGFGVRMEGGSMDDLAEYQMVRAYMAPLKRLIMAGGKVGQGEIELQGFMVIGS